MKVEPEDYGLTLADIGLIVGKHRTRPKRIAALKAHVLHQIDESTAAAWLKKVEEPRAEEVAPVT